MRQECQGSCREPERSPAPPTTTIAKVTEYDWAEGQSCEAHGTVFCGRCRWMAWGADEAKAAIAWKARCSISRFSDENLGDPFVSALNDMMSGEDPGESGIVDLAKAILTMADSPGSCHH